MVQNHLARFARYLEYLCSLWPIVTHFEFDHGKKFQGISVFLPETAHIVL